VLARTYFINGKTTNKVNQLETKRDSQLVMNWQIEESLADELVIDAMKKAIVKIQLSKCLMPRVSFQGIKQSCMSKKRL
jgi:hypothetical protein